MKNPWSEFVTMPSSSSPELQPHNVVWYPCKRLLRYLRLVGEGPIGNRLPQNAVNFSVEHKLIREEGSYAKKRSAISLQVNF